MLLRIRFEQQIRRKQLLIRLSQIRTVARPGRDHPHELKDNNPFLPRIAVEIDLEGTHPARPPAGKPDVLPPDRGTGSRRAEILA